MPLIKYKLLECGIYYKRYNYIKFICSTISFLFVRLWEGDRYIDLIQDKPFYILFCKVSSL